MSATPAPAAPAAATIPPGLLAQPAGAWKTLSDALTAEMPAIAGHPVPVACAPGAGLGRPACHIPDVPVIEVDGTLLTVDPATARPALPSDRLRYPVMWGALTHEAAHAAHTLARKPNKDKAAWCEAAHQLEESRAEARQVARRPGDRRWLRATVTGLILDDFTAAGAAPSTPREAGSAAALVLARGDAGILDPSETAPVEDKVEAVTGQDTLERLRATWREFHQAADDDIRTITRLARRWCRILKIDPDSPPPAPLVIEIPSELAEAIAEAIREIAAEVASDLAPPPAAPPGRAAERAAEKDARSRASRASKRVFGSEDPSLVTTSARSPRPDEASAARRLARTLRNATAGTRAATVTTSQVPPGRLRMGKALAGRAQRAAGAVPTAEPFTRTVSRRVPAPPLKVAIACDISLSMRSFTGPVASAAWILARAASCLPGATTATVLYSSRVEALTRPGKAPAQVTDFTAPLVGHEIGLAIDALDGALGLASRGAARLLVIVSDTDYDAHEAAAGQQRITRLARSGCGVIILRPEGTDHGDHDWTDCEVMDVKDPAATVDAIARAAARALTR